MYLLFGWTQLNCKTFISAQVGFALGLKLCILCLLCGDCSLSLFDHFWHFMHGQFFLIPINHHRTEGYLKLRCQDSHITMTLELICISIYLYRNLFSIWIYSISLCALFEKLQQSNPHHVGLFQMLASITYYNSHFLYTNTIFDRCKDVNAFALVQEICVVLSLPLKLYWQIVWFWGQYFDWCQLVLKWITYMALHVNK